MRSLLLRSLSLFVAILFKTALAQSDTSWIDLSPRLKTLEAHVSLLIDQKKPDQAIGIARTHVKSLAEYEDVNNLEIKYAKLLIVRAAIASGNFAIATAEAEQLTATLDDSVSVDKRLKAELITILLPVKHSLGRHIDWNYFNQEILGIFQSELASTPTERANRLETLSDTYYELGEFQKSLDVAERALEVRESFSEEDPHQLAESLSNIGDTLKELGRLNEAVFYQLRALAILEKAVGTKRENIASVLISLGSAYGDLGLYDRALAIKKRGLLIFQESLGKEHPDTILALNNVAFSHWELGQFKEALTLQTDVVELRKKANGDSDSETAWAIQNLAFFHSEFGNYKEALSLELEALSIYEKDPSSPRKNIARALASISVYKIKLDQYDDALAYGKKALDLNSVLEGKMSKTRANALNNLAFVYAHRGQYDLAYPLLSEALEIYEATSGSSHLDTALALNELAMMHVNLGQYEQARELLARALEIAEKQLPADHTDISLLVGNLAVVYSFLDRPSDAIPLIIRELDILEKKFGKSHPSIASALASLASLNSKVGNHEFALSQRLRAMLINQEFFGDNSVDQSYVLAGLAESYSRLNQEDLAFNFLIRTLLIRERELGFDHPHTSVALYKLAEYFRERGLNYEAIIFYKRAVNSVQSTRMMVSKIGPSELKSFTNTKYPAYKELASLLSSLGRLNEAHFVLKLLKEEEFFDFIRRDQSSAGRTLLVDFTPSEASWLSRFENLLWRFNRDTNSGLQSKEIDEPTKPGGNLSKKAPTSSKQIVFEQEIFTFIESERAARKSVVSERDIVDQGMQVIHSALIKDFVSNLGDKTALLQIFLTQDRVNFLLTTSQTQHAKHRLMKLEDLNKKIFNYVSMLRDPNSKPMKLAQELYDLLVRPVESDLMKNNIATVLLSLDGALRYVPFSSLHDGRKYVIERWTLPLFSSVAQDSLRNEMRGNLKAAGLGLTHSVAGFPALPAVDFELRSVIGSDGQGVLPGEVFMNQDFTARRFKDVTKQKSFKVIHIASHFRFSPGTEINSFLLMGDGTKLTLGRLRTENYRFDNLELLTLSACETGLGGGKDDSGREIEGFGILAQKQGAKAVIATLWSVSDKSTSSLMSDMYRRLATLNISKVQALQGAQISLLSDSLTSHPFHWAPFILMGNWK